MLKLAKTDISPELEQRVIRMYSAAVLLRKLTAPEIRAIYSHIEATRDLLSALLDRADDKHV